MELEEQLSLHHQELIELSNSGDSASLMELSKVASQEEGEVERLFEELEEEQESLDAIVEEYEEKLSQF